MSSLALLTRDFVQSVVTQALRRFMGLGKLHSVVQLAEATDIPARTLESYQGGQSVPGFDNALRLMAVLPASFATELLAPAGYRPVPLDAARACDFATTADLAACMAAMSDALRDGRIDHVERSKLKPIAAELSACLAAWASTEGK